MHLKMVKQVDQSIGQEEEEEGKEGGKTGRADYYREMYRGTIRISAIF